MLLSFLMIRSLRKESLNSISTHNFLLPLGIWERLFRFFLLLWPSSTDRTISQHCSRCVNAQLTCLSISATREKWKLNTHTYMYIYNRIAGVLVSVIASSAVDCGFEYRLCKTKDYKIGICCFSAKHAVLRRKSKDYWLTRNQVNQCV